MTTPFRTSDVPPMDFRLVLYAAGGEKIDVIYDAENIEATMILSDIGGLTFELNQGLFLPGLPNNKLSYATFASDFVEVGLEYQIASGTPSSTNGAWVEPWNGRFVRTDWTTNPAQPNANSPQTFATISWLMRMAAVDSNSTQLTNNTRKWDNMTPGAIMGTIFSELDTNGVARPVTTFTSTADSTGAAWANRVTIEHGPCDAYSVLETLTKKGVVDWVMIGRQLYMVNPGTVLAADKTALTQWRIGLEVGDAPNRYSINNVVNRALVFTGNNGVFGRSSSFTTPWGRFSKAASMGNVTSQDEIFYAQTNVLNGNERSMASYTRTLNLPKFTDNFPIYNMTLGSYVSTTGDTILTSDSPSTRDSMRVRQYTVTKKLDSGITMGVVLNSVREEGIVSQAKKLSRMVAGLQGNVI